MSRYKQQMEFAQIWYNYQKIKITHLMHDNFIP